MVLYLSAKAKASLVSDSVRCFMLKISRLADYATTLMSALAKSPEKRFSAAQLSLEAHLSTPTVSKVLKLLNEAGLVNSERGVTGGYRLSRLPESISLADIISAIDGTPAMTECCKGENVCEHDRVCGLRDNWQVINSVVFNVLSDWNLTDLNKPLPKHTAPEKIGCGQGCRCGGPLNIQRNPISHA